MTKRKRRAFTLIEVLIAIAIVVVLAGIVAINVVGTREQAKPDIAQIELANIENALQQFYVVFDRFPTEEEGIAVLWSSDTLDVEDDALSERWRRFLREPKATDVWGNEWNYTPESEREGEEYELWSNGPDGEDGTDDDITSWTEDEDGFDGGSGAP
jgi:general secretion pathway protein G